MSVSATFMLMIATKEEAFENIKAGKEGQKSEGKYPETFTWVLYIPFPITFWFLDKFFHQCIKIGGNYKLP